MTNIEHEPVVVHADAEHTDDDGHHQVHVSPTSMYLIILSALIVLTGVTAWVSFYDFGWANDIIALGIAFTKAALVVLFFMHVKYSGRIIKLIVLSAVSWLFVMLSLTYIDYGSRNSIKPAPDRVPSEYQDLLDAGYGKKVRASSHGDDGEAGH